MTTLLTLLVLASPLAVAATLTGAAHRSGHLRLHCDQLRIAAPMRGRPLESDRDILRVEHDLDAIRTRFERQPAWPSSGALGERR